MSAKKKSPHPITQDSPKPSTRPARKTESQSPADDDSHNAVGFDWQEWLELPTPTDGTSPSTLRDMGFPEFPYPHHLAPEMLAMLSPAPKSRGPENIIPSLLKIKKRLLEASGSSGKVNEVSVFDTLSVEIPGLKPEQLREVKRLCTDDNYTPPHEIRESDSWWKLPEILAGMPFKFRNLALYKFLEGIRVFGKIPVREEAVQTEYRSAAPPRITTTGPARPMGCPEAPPEGSTFILAWREGEFWNWNLCEFEYDWRIVTPDRFHPRLRNECEKYIQCLRNDLSQDDPATKAVACGILKILDQHQHPRDSNKPTDLEIGIYAGVLLARQVIYRSADELYAEKFRSKKSAWPDILRHALQRHGWELPNDELLTAIDGRREDKGAGKALAKKHQIVTFPEWPYVPIEGPMTYGQFMKKAFDLRTEYRTMSKPDSIDARMRSLLERPRRK